MKKRITLVIFLLIVLISTTSFATTSTTTGATSSTSAKVRLQIVEDNVCTIHISDNSTLEKKIISADIDKNQITMQMEIANNEEAIAPNGELMLVIDSSSSMNEEVSTGVTRKDLVLESANTLVENLLTANPDTLKIGVATFSSSTVPAEMATEADAQLVSDFSNDIADLTSKISAIEGVGNYTDLEAGLDLAHKTFTDDDSNKFLIVLTDGLPNMGLGINDLLSVEKLRNIMDQAKQQFLDMEAENINIISVLTGIPEISLDKTFREDFTTHEVITYREVIEGVFGTEETPTAGKFYNIQDTEIEETITESVYQDLIPVPKSLTNITVTDYFPQYIIDNFDFAYVEGTDLDNVSTEIDKDTNSITWTIAELPSGEKMTLQYTLTLKDTYNEEILDDVLDTNDKVDVTYTDPEIPDEPQTETSEETPKIKIVEIDPGPTTDTTTSPEPFPETGAPIILGVITIIAFAVIFFAKKYHYLDF